MSMINIETQGFCSLLKYLNGVTHTEGLRITLVPLEETVQKMVFVKYCLYLQISFLK